MGGGVLGPVPSKDAAGEGRRDGAPPLERGTKGGWTSPSLGGRVPQMRELTPEEQEAVAQAVNDMRIEGFSITEERAMALAREALAQDPPPGSVRSFLDIKKIVTGNSHELLLSGRIDAAGARARLRDVRPGAWLISPFSGWKWAKWPSGDVGWLPTDIELPATLQVMARNDMQ